MAQGGRLLLVLLKSNGDIEATLRRYEVATGEAVDGNVAALTDIALVAFNERGASREDFRHGELNGFIDR